MSETAAGRWGLRTSQTSTFTNSRTYRAHTATGNQLVKGRRAGLFHSDGPSHSRFAAGKLSTGDRYIIYNLPCFERDGDGKIVAEGMNRGRHTLAIAVAGPGEKAFTRVWKVSDVTQSTWQKASHYPCAVEHRGMLYITYTGQHGLRNCGFTAIPVASLSK